MRRGGRDVLDTARRRGRFLVLVYCVNEKERESKESKQSRYDVHLRARRGEANSY